MPDLKIKSELSIEQLAELISEKVITKLEEHFEIKSMTNYANSYEEEIYDDVQQEFEQDKPYVIWELNEKCWCLKIIDDEFKSSVPKFLRNNEKLYKKFIESLEADVKVSLLAKTVLDLINIVKNKNEINEKEVTSLFNDSTEFRKEMKSFIAYFTSEPDERKFILSKLEEYGDNIRFTITKDLLFFYAFVLTHSVNRSSQSFKEPLTDLGKLKLKRISGNYPNFNDIEKADNEIMIKSQLAFENYILKLNNKDFKYNGSLNFYFFNQLTRIYDLHILTNGIAKKTKLAKRYNAYPLQNYGKLKYQERYKFKQGLCKNKAHLINLNGVLTKKFLIKNYINSEFTSDITFLNLFNNFYDICMEELLSAIYNKHVEVIQMNEGVNRNLIVYNELIKENPYEKYMKKLEKKIKIFDSPIENTRDLVWREFYYYTYLAIYNFSKKDK